MVGDRFWLDTWCRRRRRNREPVQPTRLNPVAWDVEEMVIDVSRAFAQWIDRTTLVWDAPTAGELRYALEYAPGTSADDIASGHGIAIPLHATSGIPERLRRKYPHLTAHRAFDVDFRSVNQLRDALASPLIATQRDHGGHLTAATGVQIAGVLDDLFKAAAAEQLGPAWNGGMPRLALWAPTARSVILKLYDTASGSSHRLIPMRRNDATGVWSVTGHSGWTGRYYTYLVTVYAPTVRSVLTNEVTDPYSLSLSTDSVRSQLIDLSDPALAPPGWLALAKQPPIRQDQASIYELHIRDFSASDSTVPEPLRGTYSAFTVKDSAGMRSLRELAADGLTHVQLMPAFDFATVRERRSEQLAPSWGLASLPPDSERQQECVTSIKDQDAYDWGYAPLHYTVPEGSYATDPDGWTRIREFRSMIVALNDAGLRVVMDVVYNHTHAAGQDPGSVLDLIVPGYYQRLRDDGTVSTGTSCLDTAPENLMMGKLVVDSVITWAEQYKIDGFRFDLMGFHPKANILAVRAALDKLTSVEGTSTLLYGEGWNFGDVADDARFIQATQRNMAGTGVGTFNDRLRDAVRGGSPLDANPRIQGFGSGLFSTPNGNESNGTQNAQHARLLRYQELIKIGLTGDLKNYRLTGSRGREPTAEGVGYNAEPSEAITYVDCHDGETLFDILCHKLPPGTSMADRVRMQSLSLAIVLLGQGAAFVLAGSEQLRSKSLDRNSYNSGDWFNRLLWDCKDGNGFGAGLPPAPDNQAYWIYDKPLLANPALQPDCAAINAARNQFREFLRIRRSSPAFSIGSAAEIQRRVSFPEADTPGVISMHIDTSGLDSRWTAVIVIFNASPQTHAQPIDLPAGAQFTLHPVQAASLDPIVKRSAFDSTSAALTVPARTVAVFSQS
jgi:pullulanase-type alpha-1,6-glucosidase